MLAAPALLFLWLAAGEGPPFWGGLEPGPHAVGFRSAWVTDPGRRYTWRPDDTSLHGGGEPPTGPRPVLVNAWYPAAHATPAARGTQAPALTHGEYFEIEPAGDELGALGALPAARLGQRLEQIEQDRPGGLRTDQVVRGRQSADRIGRAVRRSAVARPLMANESVVESTTPFSPVWRMTSDPGGDIVSCAISSQIAACLLFMPGVRCTASTAASTESAFLYGRCAVSASKMSATASILAWMLS